ncbi:Autophagy protein 22 [Physocladia obscura]|uniref:Autophagy-related protein n=1 Tax=Physocladia obscura TaxID=109957 RepID=A0AAD5TB99_9FUNG|nr:Autophagy protein 22 [Physocladia obscura]
MQTDANRTAAESDSETAGVNDSGSFLVVERPTIDAQPARLRSTDSSETIEENKKTLHKKLSERISLCWNRSDASSSAVRLTPVKRGPSHREINQLFPTAKHPPLSREELNAFYIYSLACEPMSIVVFTALSTIVLQNLAAGAGKEETDHSIPCNYTVAGYKCVTNIGGAIFFISFGALADHGSYRKKFMIGFMFCAVASCFSMVAIRRAEWFLEASILVILAQIMFGASYCFYNSYIPVLSAVHWNVLEASGAMQREVNEATMNTLSAISQIYGYCGSVGCFAVAGGVIFGLQSLPFSSGFSDAGFFDSVGVSTYSMQIGICVVAVWSLIGLYWPMLYIRDRPYSPLPKGTNHIIYSWSQVIKTICRAKRMPNTFLMLLAWFILSDAITTIGSTTILFATVILGIAAPLTAGGGNYLWLYVQRKRQWSTKKMLIILVSLSILLPIYGTLGFFAPFGLKAKWELFPAGVYYGCLLGGIQSFSRVLFSELIPRGHEGEFFALYSITDKGSSWFGPLIVGAITDATHEIRYGFVFLFFMLIMPVCFLWLLNVEKGVNDAEAFRAADLEELDMLAGLIA